MMMLLAIGFSSSTQLWAGSYLVVLSRTVFRWICRRVSLDAQRGPLF